MATMVGTVLVVEDDRATARMIQNVLEMEGYRVLQAVGGASIETARTEPRDGRQPHYLHVEPRGEHGCAVGDAL